MKTQDNPKLYSNGSRHKIRSSNQRKIVISGSCFKAIQNGLSPEMRKGHEGILYLLGLTNGKVTIITSVFRPNSQTGKGFFEVSSVEIAKCVRAATNHGLQIVGQIHTHPMKAFHSEGDEAAARIRYTGYSSIVLPDYGRHLPDLIGTAVFMFDATKGFIDIGVHNIKIVPEAFQ